MVARIRTYEVAETAKEVLDADKKMNDAGDSTSPPKAAEEKEAQAGPLMPSSRPNPRPVRAPRKLISVTLVSHRARKLGDIPRKLAAQFVDCALHHGATSLEVPLRRAQRLVEWM